MEDLLTIKQKYKNIAEFIVSINQEEKIVLLEQDDFFSKFNSYNSSSKLKTWLMLSHLLGINLIAQECISNELRYFSTTYFIGAFISDLVKQ